MLCIITEHKIKTKNGGIFQSLPYRKLAEYLHLLQKFTLSDNDYENIHDKTKTGHQENQNSGIFYPFKYIKNKERKGSNTGYPNKRVKYTKEKIWGLRPFQEYFKNITFYLTACFPLLNTDYSIPLYVTKQRDEYSGPFMH